MGQSKSTLVHSIHHSLQINQASILSYTLATPHIHAGAPSPITPAAAERSAELHIPMCQIQHRLRKASRLHDTPDLDRTLLLDEFPDHAKQRWGKLFISRERIAVLSRRNDGHLLRNTTGIAKQSTGSCPAVHFRSSSPARTSSPPPSSPSD